MSSAAQDFSFASYSPDIIIILDKTYRVCFQSASFLAKTGFGQEETIGLQLTDLIHPEDFNSLKTVLACFTDGLSTPEYCNIRYRKKSGEYLPAHVTINAFSLLDSFNGYILFTGSNSFLQSNNTTTQSYHFSENEGRSPYIEILDEATEKCENQKAILDSINSGIFAFDHQLRYISFNASHHSSVRNFFGTDLKLGDSILEIIDTRVDKEKIVNRLRRALQGEQFTVQSELLTSPQEKNYFEISYNPIYSSQGKILGASVCVQNITTRVKLEQERDRLLHELLNYKQILDKSTLVSLIDLDGKITYVNDLFCKVSQFKSEEVINRHFKNFIASCYDDSFFEDIRQTLNKGIQWRGEICNKAKDNSLYWVETVINPMTDETGNLTHFISIHYNITDLKLSEEQTRRSEKAMQVAQEVAKIGSWEYDVDAKQMTWSEEMYRIYELDRNQPLPSLEDHQKFYHHEDWPDCYKLALATINEGKAFDQDFRLVFPSGHIKYINIISRPEFNEKGQVIRGFGTVMDISSRKQAEKYLQEQNDELKNTNAQLDKFVYSVTHDLKAPLASILGLINIALTDDNVNNKNDYMELMRKSVYRLDGFIRDIMDFARNSRTEIKREKILLSKKIGEIRQELSHSPEIERIKWLFEIKEESPFYSDATRLAIILNNLLSNAIRYSDPRKPDPFVQVSAKISSTGATITIADNGIGIDQKHLDKIFNMFYRATEHKSGSGLGLFIVKETVNMLKGNISVESSTGIGTTFTLELPNLKKQ